nr:Transmembrane secretion effector [uncultured bacterium]
MSNQTPETTEVNSTSTEDKAQSPAFKTLMRNRNFRSLWLAQVVSDFGDGLTNIALLFLINSLTGSAAAIATMFVVLTIPQVTIGLVAGVYVDRLDRKKIMIFSDLTRGLLVLALIFAGSRDLLWLMFVIAFLQASVGTFFTPARAALLPNIVPADTLLSANSLSQVSRIIFGLLGTAAAGLLIGAFGLYWPAFLVDALTFFASMLLVSRIVAQTRAKGVNTEATARAIFAQLVDGIKLVVRTRTLLGTLVAAGVAMLGVGAVNVLLVPLIVNDLHVSPAWFGAVEFAQTSSMVLSGGLVAILARRLKPTGMLSTSMVVLGVVIASLSLVTDVWHILVILFAAGWAVTPMQASIATIMQTYVDDNLRGRTAASLNTMISTASLVSMGAAGVLASAIGVRTVFVAGGALVIVAGIASALVFRGIVQTRQNKPQAAIAGESLSGGTV